MDALTNDAMLLRMLASSPRFANMTVADALAEIRENGFGAPSVAVDRDDDDDDDGQGRANARAWDRFTERNGSGYVA